MSHVRHSASQGGGRDAAAPPHADKQKAMQVEQLQMYKQCQFILKPRPTETFQQQHVSAGELVCCVILNSVKNMSFFADENVVDY